MATWFLPAASLRSTHRLPAARALLIASNYLICQALWSIGPTIFGVGSKFLPALREGELRGGVEQGPFATQLVHEAGTRRSAHRRHHVFGAGADAGGPARGHCFEAGVEAHAFGPCTAMSPKSDRFQPPKLWNAIGTGIGTLMPTMPI